MMAIIQQPYKAARGLRFFGSGVKRWNLVSGLVYVSTNSGAAARSYVPGDQSTGTGISALSSPDRHGFDRSRRARSRYRHLNFPCPPLHAEELAGAKIQLAAMAKATVIMAFANSMGELQARERHGGSAKRL
jgi:hypothetical protein